MTLRERRVLFTKLLAQQVLAMFDAGYEVAFDEVTERITAKDPTSDHMKHSLHHVGLAADLNLYKDGQYLSTTEDHRAFGQMWETRHPLCRWGGQFKMPDGNHYELKNEG